MSKQYRNRHFAEPPQTLRHEPPKARTPPKHVPAAARPAAPPAPQIPENTPYFIEAWLADNRQSVDVTWAVETPSPSIWHLYILLETPTPPSTPQALPRWGELIHRYLLLHDITQVTSDEDSTTFFMHQPIVAHIPPGSSMKVQVAPDIDMQPGDTTSASIYMAGAEPRPPREETAQRLRNARKQRNK